MATKCTAWKWDAYRGNHFLIKKCGKVKAALFAAPEHQGSFVTWRVYNGTRRVATGSTKEFSTAKTVASRVMQSQMKASSAIKRAAKSRSAKRK